MDAKKEIKKDIDKALKHEQDVSNDENPRPKTFAKNTDKEESETA